MKNEAIQWLAKSLRVGMPTPSDRSSSPQRSDESHMLAKAMAKNAGTHAQRRPRRAWEKPRPSTLR